MQKGVSDIKKALIISYHSKPMNVAASLRTQGYLDYFPGSSIHSTLITTNWEREGNKWKEQKKEVVTRIDSKGLTIFKIPNKSTKQSLRLKAWQDKNILITKLKANWYYYSHNQYDFSPRTIAQFERYRTFLKEHLSANRYDFALIIFSPSFHLNLIDIIHKYMPILVDFRDLWTNQWLSNNYKPKIKEKIRDALIRKYWRRQLKKASTIISVSEDHASYLERIANRDCLVVRNGYSESDFDNIVYVRSKYFRISYIGTLYSEQNIEIALKAIAILVRSKGLENLKISFLGIRLRCKEDVQKFEELINKYSLSLFTEISYERTDRFEALSKMRNSEVLLFPTFHQNKGVYSTRIFENIGSNTSVIAFPNDKDIIEKLFMNVEYCYMSDSSDEMVETLKTLYDNWSCKGFIRRDKIVMEATRKYQIDKLVNYIHTNILRNRISQQ